MYRQTDVKLLTWCSSYLKHAKTSVCQSVRTSLSAHFSLLPTSFCAHILLSAHFIPCTYHSVSHTSLSAHFIQLPTSFRAHTSLSAHFISCTFHSVHTPHSVHTSLSCPPHSVRTPHSVHTLLNFSPHSLQYQGSILGK